MSYIVLSVLISSKYPVDEAINWVRDHGYIIRKVHTTARYHRFRQHTTKYARNRGYDIVKTVQIAPDIDLIIAYPNPSQNLQGGGILSTAKAVIFGRSDYAPSQKRIIEKYGNDTVVDIKIGRTPLPTLLTSSLNILTLGAFQKILQQSSYDKLYHLFCIVLLDSGVQILVEKNQGINIKTVGKYDPKHTEYVQSTYIPSGLTFKELLDNGQRVLGNKYFPYDATKSNCQDYIIGLLKGSSILNSKLQSFVKQDVASLFKDYQNTLKVVKGITDIGSAVDTIQKGGIRSLSAVWPESSDQGDRCDRTVS